MPILFSGLIFGLFAPDQQQQQQQQQQAVPPPQPMIFVSPSPSPPPSPMPPPMPPRPAGKPPIPLDPASWIKDKDYPRAAIKAEQSGTAGFRLDIDRKGKVKACTIVYSSGSPLLDAATCSVLLRRARFMPAIDAKGNRVPGHYSSRFRWLLPRD
jgi:periplasmic protein TonB